MYHTVLVPLDGSKRAEAILPHVENLAAHYQAQVVFLQVMEPLSNAPFVAGLSYDMPQESYTHWSETAQTYLDDIKEAFQAKGINGRVRVECGRVVETIINVATSENADLIAMASHGHTGLSRVFYGSVAAGILQRVDRPLLLIRA